MQYGEVLVLIDEYENETGERLEGFGLWVLLRAMEDSGVVVGDDVKAAVAQIG